MIRHTTIAIAALLAAGAVQAYDGLREGERAMLERIEAEEADRRSYKRYKYDRDAAHHIGYSDRQEIKRLERRKRDLNSQLRNAGSYGERRGIESQIIGIDRQIEQIRAPNY